MNISGISNLIWLGSLGAGSFLGWYLYDFKQHELELSQPLAEEVFREALEDGIVVAKPKDHVLFGADVVERTFHGMNWTGVPPRAPAVVVEKPVEVVEVVTDSVGSLLSVVFTRSASFNPAFGQAMVQYIDPALKRGSDPSAVLGVGDHLPDPYAGIYVKDITHEGVLFAFADADRALELVKTPVADGGVQIVEAGADGALLPVATSGFKVISDAVPYRPLQTVMVKKGTYVIGTEVAQSFERDFASIIAQVQHRRHRSATTRQYDGIEIQRVPSNSVAAAHGVQSGDILKSINGEPVTSAQEAIQYAKNNSDRYSTWEIVIENKGAERTVIYETPAN